MNFTYDELMGLPAKGHSLASFRLQKPYGFLTPALTMADPDMTSDADGLLIWLETGRTYINVTNGNATHICDLVMAGLSGGGLLEICVSKF